MRIMKVSAAAAAIRPCFRRLDVVPLGRSWEISTATESDISQVSSILAEGDHWRFPPALYERVSNGGGGKIPLPYETGGVLDRLGRATGPFYARNGPFSVHGSQLVHLAVPCKPTGTAAALIGIMQIHQFHD